MLVLTGLKKHDIAQLLKGLYYYNRIYMSTTSMWSVNIAHDYKFISEEQYRTLDDQGKFILKSSYSIRNSKTKNYYGLNIDELKEQPANSILALKLDNIRPFKKYCEANGIYIYVAGIMFSRETEEESLRKEGLSPNNIATMMEAWELDYRQLESWCDNRIYLNKNNIDEVTAKHIHKYYTDWVEFQRSLGNIKD